MRSPEYREKMSKAMKGVNKGDKNAAKRPEVRERISMSMRGKSSGHNFNVKKGFHWYTNGVINKRGYECPKGFWIGKTKK